MNPIHFQGLNCYHDCIISIVNHFGVNYPAAFATLWTETEFRYDPYREAYLTKRMLTNLELLGAKVERLDYLSKKEIAETLSLLHVGEFVVIGMDAFYIPWNQFYRTFHGPHYFIAQNVEGELLPCIDPTYNKKTEEIVRKEIMEHTFDMSRISRVAKQSVQIEDKEADEVIRTHPIMHKVLLSRIHGCVGGEQENIIRLAKYIDAIICNRYLYRFFLEQQALPLDKEHLFLSSDFFLEWTAVKNGLYKAAISRSNEGILNDVCSHFNHVIDEEIAMAERIICSV